MGERSVRERAELLAQMAPHSSVSVPVLADEESAFSDSRLVDRPPAAYLEDSEAPAYVLTNRKRGIALGTKRNRKTPDEGRGTVILVTGRRTLCLVGIGPRDRGVTIPHESVVEVDAHTGLLAHRLVLETADRTYHCWVDRSTETSLLAEVRDYVADRAEGTRDDRTEASESRLTYRGEAFDPSASLSQNGSNGTGDHEDDEDDRERRITYRGQPVDPSVFE